MVPYRNPYANAHLYTIGLRGSNLSSSVTVTSTAPSTIVCCPLRDRGAVPLLKK